MRTLPILYIYYRETWMTKNTTIYIYLFTAGHLLGEVTIRFGDPTFNILVLNGRFGGTEATEDCYYSNYAC